MTLHSSKQEFRVYDKPEPEVGQEMEQLSGKVWKIQHHYATHSK